QCPSGRTRCWETHPRVGPDGAGFIWSVQGVDGRGGARRCSLARAGGPWPSGAVGSALGFGAPDRPADDFRRIVLALTRTNGGRLAFGVPRGAEGGWEIDLGAGLRPRPLRLAMADPALASRRNLS